MSNGPDDEDDSSQRANQEAADEAMKDATDEQFTAYSEGREEPDTPEWDKD